MCSRRDTRRTGTAIYGNSFSKKVTLNWKIENLMDYESFHYIKCSLFMLKIFFTLRPMEFNNTWHDVFIREHILFFNGTLHQFQNDHF